MKETIKRKAKALYLSTLAILVLSLTACGGGGKLSTEVVSGVAAVGAPLAGEVTLKDSSDHPREKVAVIDQNGAFAFDVTGMTPPYMLQAKGSAGGTAYQLHSFAPKTGTANVNPLSNVIVANAAGVADPATLFAGSDEDQMKQVAANLPAATSRVMTTLQPLLTQYGAAGTDPITSAYSANHQNLDLMFDEVQITLSGGTLTIVNNQSGGVICNGSVTDIASMTVNTSNISPVPAPAPPAGMTATGGMGQVSLAWSAVSGATSYNVYYGTTPGVTTATGTKVSVSSTGYLQTGLMAGATYYYVVTAVNASGESAASAAVQAMTTQTPPAPTAPAPPTGVTAAGGTNQATVTWSTVTGATSYNIYWSTTSGVTTATGTKLANATSPAVQAGLDAGTTYYYIVTAVNATGESAASSQVAAMTLVPAPTPTVPAAVAGVSATGGQNQVTVTWQPVTGASSYNIYWSGTSGVTTANGTRISAATSPYLQTGLSAGTTYYYIVTAVNSVGESVASTQASATTSAPVVLDGLALYNQYCYGCHGTAKMGKTAAATQGAITANTGGMGSLSSLTADQIAAIATTTAPVVTPPPACGSCHAIPPATGRHPKHTFTGCATCHGTGYSSTTVNSATHANGVKDVGGTSGWNAATRTCSNSCHGSRAW